ncbi:uncharacterized protein LOC131071481 [Cryptomeria japonica]|uniref:uncharacterized protein LOC131071481 n=1 Tax=Cryptomeria japonica TaxID=3369 RepID=UPI0027DA10AD|nr:uncharacterized protein LOC131071481 [Cryptomeria japonica]
MAPFHALYGRPCQTPLSWDQLEDRVHLGPDMLRDMEQQVVSIREQLVATQDWQNKYVDVHRVDRQFSIDDRVFLRVHLWKSPIRYRKGSNLALSFVGSFEILERICPIAYRLSLLPSLSCIHDVFHVLILHQYHPNISHILDWTALLVEDGQLALEPVGVLEHRHQVLRGRDIE